MPPSHERPLRFIVIGAGVSGVLAAIKLKQAGFANITVFEKDRRVGGTWRDNRYPGVACDIPSHLYSYSFAPNAEWSHRYAPGAEILGYLEEVAARFEVTQHIRFGEEVSCCALVDGEWRVETKNNGHFTADVIIAATGVTHHPNLPHLAGIETFSGKCLHSAQWPDDLDITGKRIGIIGTGSSAVQLASASVRSAAKVVVFQRTAQWIMPQENPAYSEDEKASFRSNPITMSLMRAGMQRRFVDNFSDAVTDVDSPRLTDIENMCREYLETEVTDPILREQLRPTYRAACKRLVVSPDFYRAIQQPNAELVIANIERIEPKGVRTRDGQLHELDVLVLATGFRTDRFIRPARVLGLGGRNLDDAWSTRPSAYLCVAVPEFPNLFLLNGPNGPVGNFPLIEVAEIQMRYLLQLIALLRRGECTTISPKVSSTQAFEAARIEQAKRTVWMSGCRSWYLDESGVPAAWPWSIAKFRELMECPKLEDFELRHDLKM
ncbi:MAG TPA: NAD(P)/FAD-dependent oxidoreductase [Steroidobacteraceae bacterium]|nr:NAD(P)/FAD-dependent oxidoreductase [Steroidobacteraceae bacterium]